MVRKYCDLYYDEPTLLWDEAIPLGCGKQGTLLYGDGSPLIFSVDKGNLWDTRQTSVAENPKYTFRHLVDLVRSGQYDKIEGDFTTLASVPTKLPPNRIKANFGEKAQNMSMHLSLQRAEATAELTFSNGEKTIVKAVEHARELYGIFKMTGRLPEIEIQLADYNPDETNMDFTVFKSLKRLGYGEGSTKTEKQGEYTVYTGIQPTANDYTFAIVLVTKMVNGSLEGAYTTVTDKEGENYIENCVESLKKVLDKGYDKLLPMHLSWWKKFWKESSITIDCDRRIEKLWYINNYFLGAGSRKEFLPMALQGVWTADVHAIPPWRGDYHNNQNVQQTYNSYIAGNHMDAGMAMVNLMIRTKKAGRKHARRFYKTKGLSLPPTMTLDGEVITGWPQVNGIPTNHLWLCKILERHGRYLGDDKFLEKVAYPYFKETSECVLSILEEGEDGLLYLPVSTSPEHYEATPKSWLKPNSNYDLACLRYFFGALRDMAKTLGYKEDQDKWEKVFSKLPYYDMLENGELTIAKGEPMVETYLHHGHAMAIFPFNELDSRNEKDLNTMQKTVTRLEVLGTGKWVGYSYPWMASIYTRLNRGEAARHQLMLFDECYCTKNGFNLNGDFRHTGASFMQYRPFTLEANLAAADAIQDMLMQSHKEMIEIFPAIPDKWAKYGVEFTTLRAKGGFLVSAKIKERKTQYVKVQATGNRQMKIALPMENPNVIVSDKSAKYEIANGILTIDMKKGDFIELKI